MGTMNINLDKEVEKAIHKPACDGMPLYTRVDNNYTDKMSTRTQKWIEMSNKVYGSPDNIRKVFITHKAIYVEFYQPLKGSDNRELTRTVKYNKDIEDFEKVYDSLINGTNEYRVTKSGLGALVNSWVCSNIEEIYFDWTIFLSETILNLGLGNLLKAYTKEGHTNQLNNKPIKEIFNHYCLNGNSDIESLNNRFPRLRTIGYIQNLDIIYNSIKRKPGVEALLDSVKPWWHNDLVAQAIKDPTVNVSIYQIRTPKLSKEHSIKSGIYLYDKEVLEPYFANLDVKIDAYYSNQAMKKADERKQEVLKKVNKTKSGFEEFLDGLMEKSGADMTCTILDITFKNSKKEERDKILAEMSEEGRTKYISMLKAKKRKGV